MRQRRQRVAVAHAALLAYGAGIYVEKIVGFIKDKKKQISKSFTLYAVEGGGSGGIVTLKLVRCAAHCASRRVF